MNTNLTASQNDYAYFLPATSSFYATFIGKQRYRNYVDPSRVPKSFAHGVESLNFLDPEKGLFYYDHCLYSAGHANLDLKKVSESEDMFRNRNRTNSWVLGDSGGFQIGKGKWEGNWLDPNCPKAQKKRSQVLNWMDTLMDYGMCLDIPSWVAKIPAGRAATKITTTAEAIKGTFINNDYFINNRNGNCKFLNVLQGEDHRDAENWYQHMKKYCDPKLYPDRHFNGWAMGGQNMCDIHLTLKRIVTLKFDNMLEKGLHDWMHFLGTSKLDWALLLTDIQRAVRKHHNSNFTISFDCASPFLATANGQIYVQTEIKDRKKWMYRMTGSLDDKSYYQDTRLFKDVVVNDGHLKHFESSPVIDQVPVKDVCIYGPTCTNKNGKIGSTSWDSFSYAIMMGHNVWTHINSVQEANRQYDNGLFPNTLLQEKTNRIYFKDLVNAIIEASDKGKAESLLEEHNKFWMSIPGTRGASGVRTISTKHTYNLFFEEKNEEESNDDGEFNEEQKQKLEDLEATVED